jgi:hypothetical protein
MYRLWCLHPGLHLGCVFALDDVPADKSQFIAANAAHFA